MRSFIVVLLIAWIVLPLGLSQASPSSDPNYYEILEIPKDATRQEVKSAMHRLAHLYHPDHNLQEFEAARNLKQEIFKSQILQAYKVLSNPLKRQFYDLELKIAAKSGMSHAEIVNQAMAAYEDFSSLNP